MWSSERGRKRDAELGISKEGAIARRQDTLSLKPGRGM
jgi:hypothetical protein